MKVIATVSGKGGTGKTTISVAIAKTLASKHRVGLLDIDVSGANAHKLVNVVEPYDITSSGDGIKIVPAKAEVDGRQIDFLSIALVSESYVGWKPGQHGDFVEQMLTNTDWDVDYLVLDAPPGFHDDVIRALKHTNVTIFTTLRHPLAKLDAMRTFELLSDMEVPIAGQYINMAYVVCPKCGEKIRIFKDEVPLPVPVIEEIPITDGLPELSYDKLMKAIKNAKVYKVKKRSFISRTLVEMFLRGLAHVKGED